MQFIVMNALLLVAATTVSAQVVLDAIASHKAAHDAWGRAVAGGDINEVVTYFADDAVIHFDELANFFPHSNYKKTYACKNSECIKAWLLDVLANLKISVFEYSADFGISADKRTTVINHHNNVFGEKNNGYLPVFVQYYLRWTINKEGKVSEAWYTPYNKKKIDAKSVVTRFYNGYTTGQPEIAVAQIDAASVTVDVVDMQSPTLDGHYEGMAGFGEMIVKVNEAYDQDSHLANYKCDVHANSPDGKTVTADVVGLRTYKTGGLFEVNIYQRFTVNNAGLIVSLDSVLKSSKPMNARAAWDTVIACFVAGNLECVWDLYAPDLQVGMGGLVNAPGAKEMFAATGWTNLKQTLGKDDFIKQFSKMLVVAPVTKMEFTYLSQGDNAMTVRYDIAQKFQDKTLSFISDYTFDFDDNFRLRNIFGNILKVTYE